MQHVARVNIVREAPVAAAIEIAGVSHVYDGREGQVPALMMTMKIVENVA